MMINFVSQAAWQESVVKTEFLVQGYADKEYC
jgi:hypothetical protein